MNKQIKNDNPPDKSLATKPLTTVEHPCKFCKKPVEVELWESRSAIKEDYLITCDGDSCHRMGFAYMGWEI